MDVHGRIYVFVLDNLAMDAAVALRTRHVMRRFFRENFADDDIAAIVFTGAGRGQPLTGERRLLDAALDRLMSDADPTGNVDFHRVTAFLADTTASMAEITSRRKALVLVTPSAICSLEGPACGESLDYVLRTAHRSDISIYAIDPAGLNAYRRSSAEFANPNSTYADGYSEAASHLAARAAFGAARREWRGPLDGARYLAEVSGGFAVVNSNSIRQGFARLVRENSSYYLLGYYSTSTQEDGKLRRHRVISAGKGVRMVHRIGYMASPSSQVK